MKGAKEAELIEIGSDGGFPRLQFTCPHCNEVQTITSADFGRQVAAVMVEPCERAGGHHFHAVRRADVSRKKA